MFNLVLDFLGNSNLECFINQKTNLGCFRVGEGGVSVPLQNAGAFEGGLLGGLREGGEGRRGRRDRDVGEQQRGGTDSLPVQIIRSIRNQVMTTNCTLENKALFLRLSPLPSLIPEGMS